ncbi:transcriptional initiation protein Tat [Planomonospora sphaerica]|uniref:Transcriptional initiation protein Tat n=1 Tax=Planomonospora sphaerica TaxID=161355 RepID=A0A161LJB8_9ACTN|nr:bacteriocin fulvocin C-related protein [Planomonospora sphaerica]GAT68994.1 transcriptional initiation protein Tat [Planomonospora sphaerica]
MSSGIRWILGFDASCGTCSKIAEAAKDAAGERLEVLPLAHQDVQQWRAESLGAEAPWVPALIRVDGNQVRAWTGPAMGLRLLGRLGPRAAVKLFKALGELSQAGRATESDQAVGRRHFFKFGAGVSIAAGIVLTGKAPALADEIGKAHAWVAANKDRLPQDYATFSRYSETYRRAIYAELDPTVRSRLWTAHIAQYRKTHPDLSIKQQHILAKLEAHVGKESTFHPRTTTDMDAADERLQFEVIEAFGKEEARNLAGTLGPAEPHSPTASLALLDCECSTNSDWCGGSWRCYYYRDCRTVYDGCGWLYQYACNGMCMRLCSVASDDSPDAAAC